MSDTPRTDAAVIATDMPRGAPVAYVTADFARLLEKESAAMFRALKECVDALATHRETDDWQESYAYRQFQASMRSDGARWKDARKFKPGDWM